MLACSAYNGDKMTWTYKCYDNVFADTKLENGSPSGIYAYFDLFTWRGLISFTAVFLFELWLYNFFDNLFWSHVLMLSYFMNEGAQNKYCATGELTISDPWEFGWFEIDLCDSLEALKTWA